MNVKACVVRGYRRPSERLRCVRDLVSAKQT